MYVTYIYHGSKHEVLDCIEDYGYKTVLKIKTFSQNGSCFFHWYSTKKNHVVIRGAGPRRVKSLSVGDYVLLKDGFYGRVISIENIGYQPVRKYSGEYKKQLVIDNVCYENITKTHNRTPISSYGIIAYRMMENRRCQFLLVQRKNTHGYTDFIRGRYYNKHPDTMLRLYLSEMVLEERKKLATLSFDQLWADLWIKNNKISRGEYEKAKSRFKALNIKHLLATSESPTFSSQEYGFPKGRRNRKEEQIDCAIREFQEETGLLLEHNSLLSKKITFEETFTGTNGIQYRHLYFVAKISNRTREPRIDSHNLKQCEEIRHVCWADYEDTLEMFRPYDLEKKEVLKKAFEYISKREFLVNRTNTDGDYQE